MVARSRPRFPRGLGSTLAACLAACVAAACGKDGATPEAPAASAPVAADQDAPARAPARSGRGAAAPATLTAEEPYESAELGALHGTVLFPGAVPERFALGATEMKECQHHPGVDQRSNVVVVNDGKVAFAFVTLRSGYDEGRVPVPASAPATLDQRGCMYVPRALGVRVGQKLLVSNSDPTNHNVHTKSKRNRELNFNMGRGQAAVEFVFEHAEKPVPFRCDIHPWMGAEVYVEEHPWFAVTDEQGVFRIGDVPPGEYVVEARHEMLGTASGSVKVTAGRSAGFTLTLPGK